MRRTATSIRCRDVGERLWEYLDGALERPHAAAIRTHITECVSCRDRHDEARALLRAVARTQGTHPAPDALRERIDALLRERGLLS